MHMMIAAAAGNGQWAHWWLDHGCLSAAAAGGLTPKKSRSCEAATATTTHEKAFCQGKLMVQSITSDSVRVPESRPPPAWAWWLPPPLLPSPLPAS